jgi:hypothetical protein
VTIKISNTGPNHFTIILYGFETWSLALREEHRIRMFENRVFWRIF